MEYLEKAREFLAKGDDVDSLKREIMELSSKQAALNYKLYDAYLTNRTLAIRIYGYLSENWMMGGGKLDEETRRIVDKYLLMGRNR